MAAVQPVSDATFEELVLKSNTPVLVDFWAGWCSPCKQVAPIVEELAGQYAGQVTFYSMDIDANGETPMNYGIMSIPTLLVFSGGQVVKTISGARPKKRLGKQIARTVRPQGRYGVKRTYTRGPGGAC
ncbi:MAG: thioredoxin [Propionibacteriaceae bacterium]|jgi:thioredoxin 1|nr:thioredoxin [Propionibacteriaceae bacterium]